MIPFSQETLPLAQRFPDICKIIELAFTNEQRTSSLTTGMRKKITCLQMGLGWLGSSNVIDYVAFTG